MDPFSIAVGAVSLLHVSLRLLKHIKYAWSEVAAID